MKFILSNYKKKNIKLILMTSLSLFCTSVSAQYYSASQQQSWLQKAEASKPAFKRTTHHPLQEVDIVKDAKAFQGFKAVKVGNINDLYSQSFKQKKEVIVDFGEHLVGNVSFKIKDIVSMQDAILRFKVTFGEVPSDLALPIEPYTGELSRGWLQDFICDVSYDGCFKFNRRITARYMKIELIGSSVYSDFCFDNITFEATTSAGESKAQLAATTPQIFKDIARVSENTLRECMQGVYEDGPKRDQRLWMGDFHLEALANTASFQQYDVTKRCLYLLAGLANPENGLLNSNMVEYPTPHAQRTFFVDYALSYILTLDDYLKSTGDVTTAKDLWPVVKNQIAAILSQGIDKNHLYGNTSYQYPGMIYSTIFFDWAPIPLDNHAAIQGLLIYAMEHAIDIAKKIGTTQEIKDYPAKIKQLRTAGKKAYWDSKRKLVISGEKKQNSYTGTSWAILGGIINGKDAQDAIKNVTKNPEAIKPGTPYANHFLVQAMLNSGLKQEAKEYVDQYWGGMVRLGADTFWEYYVPENHLFSSYNGYTLLNSYCHAWSCTPIYFIVNYPEVFQR